MVPVVWVDRTMALESAGKNQAIGDNGRSRGPYQIQERPWTVFGGRLPWATWAHDSIESRRIATRILAACMKEARKHGKPLTFKEIRYIYRHGGY